MRNARAIKTLFKQLPRLAASILTVSFIFHCQAPSTTKSPTKTFADCAALNVRSDGLPNSRASLFSIPRTDERWGSMSVVRNKTFWIQYVVADQIMYAFAKDEGQCKLHGTLIHYWRLLDILTIQRTAFLKGQGMMHDCYVTSNRTQVAIAIINGVRKDNDALYVVARAWIPSEPEGRFLEASSSEITCFDSCYKGSCM